MSIRDFAASDVAELALIVTGGLLVVGAVAYARGASAKVSGTTGETRKPDGFKPITKGRGVTVTAQDCRDWTFDNAEDYHASVRPVYDARISAGLYDPWMITDSVMSRVVPMCLTIDQGARNPQEAFLQYVIFIDVISHLREDGHMNDDGFTLAELEIRDYAIEHGVPESAITEWRNNE